MLALKLKRRCTNIQTHRWNHSWNLIPCARLHLFMTSCEQKLADLAPWLMPYLRSREGRILRASSVLRQAFRNIIRKRRILKGKILAGEGRAFRVQYTHESGYPSCLTDNKYYLFRDARVAMMSKAKDPYFADFSFFCH